MPHKSAEDEILLSIHGFRSTVSKPLLPRPLRLPWQQRHCFRRRALYMQSSSVRTGRRAAANPHSNNTRYALQNMSGCLLLCVCGAHGTRKLLGDLPLHNHQQLDMLLPVVWCGLSTSFGYSTGTYLERRMCYSSGYPNSRHVSLQRARPLCTQGRVAFNFAEHDHCPHIVLLVGAVLDGFTRKWCLSA